MTIFSLEKYCLVQNKNNDDLFVGKVLLHTVFIQDKNYDDLFVGKVLLHHQSLVPLRVNVAIPKTWVIAFG